MYYSKNPPVTGNCENNNNNKHLNAYPSNQRNQPEEKKSYKTLI